MPVFYYPTSSNGVPLTTIDAKGDLLVGTANDTVTRLAAGTDTWILTADSTQASGLKWQANISNPSLGGDLSGTVSTATIVAGAVDGGKIAASIKDAAAGTPSLRSLGSTATTACAGNDARLSDARTPLTHSHAAADITSGVIATARLASTGTANATTFLRGDQSWAAPSVFSARYAVATVSATAPTGTWNADYQCSGTTDNSGTIQSAIDAVALAGGGIVQLSDGIFYIANSIKIKTGVWIKGQGKATKMRSRGSNWVSGNAIFENFDRDTHAFGISDMRIESPTSVGSPGQGYVHGIYITNQIPASNNNSLNLGDYSGTIDTSPDPVPYIANIQFYKTKGTALMIADSPTATHTTSDFGDTRGCTIQNIFALDSRDYGILSHASDSYFADVVCGGGANTTHQIVINGSNNRVIGCKGYYAGQSNLYISGNRNMVMGFESQDSGQDGAVIAGNNSQIHGLVSDSASRLSSGVYDGVVLSGSRNVISASIFNRGVGWNTRCGINIGGSDNIIQGTIDVNTNFTGNAGVKAYAGTRTGQTMMACTVNGESLDEFRIGTGRAYFLAPVNSAPTNSIIPTNGGWTVHFDTVSSPMRLVFTAKDGGGNVKTGSINMA